MSFATPVGNAIMIGGIVVDSSAIATGKVLTFNGTKIVYSTPSGGGGSSFDQDLNTTDTVVFAGITGPLTGNVTGNVSGSAGSLSANIAESRVTNLVSDLAAKAPLASPTFTGNVTGTFVGNLTGDVTGNVSGTAGGLSANIAESQVTNLVADLAAKTAKVVPAAANNIAQLDASGNLLDGGRSVASITAQMSSMQTAIDGKASLAAGVTNAIATLSGAGGLQNSGVTLSQVFNTATSNAINKVVASPASGGSGALSLRSLVAADIPDIAQSQVTSLVSALAAKAPLASPTFTGVLTGATALFNPPTFSGVSGTQVGLEIRQTINVGTGSAAMTDLLINRTNTANGSGAQLLIDAQVGGVSKFKVDKLGSTTVGALTTSGTVAATSFSGSGGGLTNVPASSLTGSGGYAPASALGTGAHDNTVWLRGDQTWAAPSINAVLTYGGANAGSASIYGLSDVVANTMTVGQLSVFSNGSVTWLNGQDNNLEGTSGTDSNSHYIANGHGGHGTYEPIAGYFSSGKNGGGLTVVAGSGGNAGGGQQCGNGGDLYLYAGFGGGDLGGGIAGQNGIVHINGRKVQVDGLSNSGSNEYLLHVGSEGADQIVFGGVDSSANARFMRFKDYSNANIFEVRYDPTGGTGATQAFQIWNFGMGSAAMSIDYGDNKCTFGGYVYASDFFATGSVNATAYSINNVVGFTGTGSYTSFTIDNGIITAAS